MRATVMGLVGFGNGRAALMGGACRLGGGPSP